MGITGCLSFAAAEDSELGLPVVREKNGYVGEAGKCDASNISFRFGTLTVMLDLVRESVLATDRRMFVREADIVSRLDGFCPNIDRLLENAFVFW